MMPRIVFSLLLVTMTALPLWADVILSGLLRNDSFFAWQEREPLLVDTVEARVLLSARKEKKWLFYSDIRAYMLYAHVPGSGSLAQAYQNYMPYQGYTTAKITRAFVRLYSPAGDFTLGKTYINFGNGGFFNPFELDRTVNFSDIGADREGILGLEYVVASGELFQFKIYGGMYNFNAASKTANLPLGMEFEFHLPGWEFGAVAHRMTVDRNVMGIYFKGDAEVGLQGAYGAHVNDAFNSWYHEANLGIDYSFLSGKLIVTVMGYFNSSKALSSSAYPALLSFPNAMFYVYGDITGVIDEFLTLSLMAFVNCVDGTMYLSPSVRWTIVDGLSLLLQVPIVIGSGGEFPSLSRYSINNGEFGFLLRVEGKF